MRGRLSDRVNVSVELSLPILASGSDDARELWSIVALLAVIGIGLAMLAVFAIKATRPDRELLAPLEVMGRRKWRRSDPVWQRRELDAVRPAGAQPLAPAPAVPVPLEGFEEGPPAVGFDDLDELSDLADLESGVDHDITELPGGVVFDADPTPPSGEVPVVVAVAAEESSLAALGIDWRPPDPEDLTVPADEPALPPPAPEQLALAVVGADGDDGDDGDADDGKRDDEPASAPADEPVEVLATEDGSGSERLADEPFEAGAPSGDDSPDEARG